MSDAFVNLVTFQATGLDKIKQTLESAKTKQDSLTASTEKYNRTLASTVRTANAYERGIKSSTLAVRAREMEFLVRQHERLNRAIERQSLLSKIGGGLARVGGALGGAAGAAGAAGFGTALAGLSGTVPMARLQNQFQRLAWELGNTLTPQIEAVTKRIAGAANWLSRQDTDTQDLIGYGLTGAGIAGGARLVGLPVGGAIRGAGRTISGGLGRLGGPPIAPMTQAEALYRSQYGSQGLPGGGGGGSSMTTGGLSGVMRLLGTVAGVVTAGQIAHGEFIGNEQTRARRGRSTPEEIAPYYAEYNQRFADPESRRARLSLERSYLQTAAADASGQTPGTSGMNSIKRGRGIGGIDLDKLTDVRKRQQTVEAMIAEYDKTGGGGGHRGNALVGGTFGEVGSGYYTAASALAQTGFGMRDAGGNPTAPEPQKNIATILEQIRDRLPDKGQPPDPSSNRAFVGGNFKQQG